MVPSGLARGLIVEDNVMNQEITQTILRFAGYEVTVVGNSRAQTACIEYRRGGCHVTILAALH